MHPEQPVYLFDDVRIVAEEFKVLKAGRPISLEPKAFDVLLYLVRHPNQLITKDELLDAVWKDAFVTPNAMTRVVAHLRRALGDDAKEARYIETVPTRGYRFIAPVEALAAAPQESAVPEAGVVRSPARWRPALPVGAILLLALFAILWQRYGPVREAESPVRVLRPVQFSSSAGLDVQPAFSPDGQLIAYASDRSGAFEIYVRAFEPGAKQLQLTDDGNENLYPSFSPDGRSVAFASVKRRGIFRVPALGGSPQRLTDFGTEPVWSPDGRNIVFRSSQPPSLSVTDYYFSTGGSIWIVPASGGDPRQVTGVAGMPGVASAASWSPDGREVRFVNFHSGEFSVWTYRLADESSRKCFSSTEFPYSDATFSRDGTRMWFVRAQVNGDIGIWELNLDPATLTPNGVPRAIYEPASGVPRDLTLSPDGTRLAFTAVDSTSSVLTEPIATGGQPAAVVPLTQDVTYRYAIVRSSVDGRRVLYQSFPQRGRGRLWVADAEGVTPPILIDGPGELQGYGSFGPDNEHVFFANLVENRVEVRSWNLSDGASEVLGEVPRSAGQLSFSPDGSRVAFHDSFDEPMKVYLQDLPGRQPRVAASGQEDFGYPRFSRDGKWISFEVLHAVRGGNDVAIMPAAGGPADIVLRSDQPSFSAGWMPDNDRILFAGFRDGAWNIFTVSRSTRDVVRLTDYRLLRTYVRYPDWLIGDRIVYEFNETKGNIFVATLP